MHYISPLRHSFCAETEIRFLNAVQPLMSIFTLFVDLSFSDRKRFSHESLSLLVLEFVGSKKWNNACTVWMWP